MGVSTSNTQKIYTIDRFNEEISPKTLYNVKFEDQIVNTHYLTLTLTSSLILNTYTQYI